VNISFKLSAILLETTPKQIREKRNKQKLRMLELFNANFSEYKNKIWWEYTTEEYKQFLCAGHPANKSIEHIGPELIQKLYPLVKKKGRQPTYILIMPKLIKEGLMLCDTEKGKQVRRFYIDMMDVMELYVKYQNKTNIITLETKMDKMLLKLNTSERKSDAAEARRIESEAKADEERAKADEERAKADEERAKADEERAKAEARFNDLMARTENVQVTLNSTKDILMGVANEHVPKTNIPLKKYEVLIIIKDSNDDDCPYYVIRTQKENINKAIKKIKDRFIGIDVLVRIDHPNSKKLWQSFKSKYGKFLINTGSNWFGLNNRTTEDLFVRALTKLSDDRKVAN
jgi:predicted  nucleic acid-binding Zn-ribbon protein